MEESRRFEGTKILQRVAEEDINSFKEKIQTRIKGLKDFDFSNVEHLMNFITLVDDEFISTKKKMLTRLKGINKDGNHDGSAFKQMKLQFRNPISSRIFTGKEIKGEGGAAIEVALIDVSTGDVAVTEPEASAIVEIVLFKGEPDHASEGANEENIVRGMEGKKPFLLGNTRLKLHKGIAKLKSIKLKNGAEKLTNPSIFHLGARVVDMVDKDCIKAAKTGPFTVKSYRAMYCNKHDIPSLRDEVYRLANIGKRVIAKRLQDNGIKTVEDFLICHQMDPEGLKKIVEMEGKKWRDAVTNARACGDKRTYCCTDEHKTTIVFNVRGDRRVLGPHLNNQSQPTNTPSENYKARAYKQWKEDIMRFDDETSLEEHLAGLRKSWDDPLDLPVTIDVPADDYYLPGNGGEMFGGLVPSSPQSHIILEPLWNFGESETPCGLASHQEQEPNAAATSVESEGARNGHARNGWKLLSRLWRRSSVIKKQISKRYRSLKRQKVC